MAFITYQEFVSDCDEQDVTVNDMVIRTGQYGLSDSSYAPTDVLAMLYEANTELRLNPDKPLIDKPFEVPDRYQVDPGATALASLLNQSLERKPPTEQTVNCNSCRKIASCALTEVRMLATLSTLRPQRKNRPFNPNSTDGAQLFINDGAVVLMRKSDGERSSLTFTDMTINGITYPAGSIMRTEIPDDCINAKTGEQLAKPDLYSTPAGTEVLPFNTIIKAAFVRLSVLAYSPKQRQNFDEITDHLSDIDKIHERNLYYYASLQELGEHVQQVADASDN
jgi:hypothetical protein